MKAAELILAVTGAGLGAVSAWLFAVDEPKLAGIAGGAGLFVCNADLVLRQIA